MLVAITGHWIGDPCEYCLMSVHVMPTAFCNHLRELGDEFVDEARVGFGMTAGFGSCTAQAHNQGELRLH